MGRFERSSTVAEYYHDNAAPAAPAAPATTATTAPATTAIIRTTAAVKQNCGLSMRFLCLNSGTLTGVGDCGAVSA